MAALEVNGERSATFSCYSTAEEVTEGIDASNKTAIITGASNGIGAETARVLAMRGACVVLAVRTLNAGEKVKSRILQETPQAHLHVVHLDLSSMASVRTFYDTFKSLNLPLNILINNAGILNNDFELSKDGVEMHFATNHIGHFLLTSLLIEKMKRTVHDSGIQGRIINISSLGHALFTYPEGIHFDKINDKSSYHPLNAYGQSKLANILHAKDLARRFQEEGVDIVANAVHPGAIFESQLYRNASKELIQEIADIGSSKSIFLKTIYQGAATQCFVALHPSISTCTGKYFADCKEDKASDMSNDLNLSNKLWDFSILVTSSKNN